MLCKKGSTFFFVRVHLQHPPLRPFSVPDLHPFPAPIHPEHVEPPTITSSSQFAPKPLFQASPGQDEEPSGKMDELKATG